MSHQPISVIIAGGGTAGHIEPALAVGEALRTGHGARVTALGTTKGLEQDLIPARGVDLRLITPVPIPRKLCADLFKLPVRLAKAIVEVRSIARSVDANVVFGTGGYVAAPAYLAAKSLGLPFYVLETNALAGIANKLGVQLGGVGLNATAQSGMPGEVVGIPVRPGFVAQSEQEREQRASAARAHWGLSPDRPVIVVTGGSQGAQSINRAIAGAIEDLTAHYQVLHAYGKKNEAPQPRPGYVPVPYIDDMAAALSVADLVICRSGAMTVAEVSASRTPAIYIPLPIGNGEQALNCLSLVDAGAAILINDSELEPAGLVAHVRAILDDEVKKQAMVAAVAQSSAGDVAQRIANTIAADLAAKDNKE